jgi:hypothetical protein
VLKEKEERKKGKNGINVRRWRRARWDAHNYLSESLKFAYFLTLLKRFSLISKVHPIVGKGIRVPIIEEIEILGLGC